MNKLKSIILEEIGIYENKQLADKIYFNTGKLSNDDKEKIYSITNGDNTTKFISDIYFRFKNSFVIDRLPEIHKQLLSYNSNVFPIIGFDLYNTQNIYDVYESLIQRQVIIDIIKKLPSQAIRNLKEDIRKPRESKEFRQYLHDLEYFMAYFSMLGNRDKELRQKIYNKMFKSKITIDDLTDFVEQKENLLGGANFTKEDIINLVRNDSDEDMFIIYDKNNVMVLQIESAEAIKKIGCNSLWCFTYGKNNYKQWYQYSYNGIVYIIIDLSMPSDDQEFMHVLIQPLKSEKFYNNEKNESEIPLFNMANENYYNPYPILKRLVGVSNIRKIFTFGY